MIEMAERFDEKLGAKCVDISGVTSLSVADTFDCGQCFRFEKREGYVDGVAYGRYIRICQTDDKITLCGCDSVDYTNIWRSFIALDEDYDAVKRDIGEHFGVYGDTIFSAMERAGGIRILRQEPWEALCSFIISQNNNIPRIKKIIRALSEKYGEAFTAFGETYYAFPTPEALSAAGEDELKSCGTGFRARYILDAAKKVSSGEIDFSVIQSMDDEEAAKYLMTICGVGAKVAACTLLYGFHRTAAFPIDVWIKRVLDKYYPGGIDISSLGAYAGIAQQYLFYYERYIQAQEAHDINKGKE